MKNDEGEKVSKEDIRLEWRDWVALFLASLQTVFLPLLVTFLLLLVVYIFLIFFN